VFLFAITIHEASHGWAAYKMGDLKAHSLGRDGRTCVIVPILPSNDQGGGINRDNKDVKKLNRAAPLKILPNAD